jgi:hypothetical protein
MRRLAELEPEFTARAVELEVTHWVFNLNSQLRVGLGLGLGGPIAATTQAGSGLLSTAASLLLASSPGASMSWVGAYRSGPAGTSGRTTDVFSGLRWMDNTPSSNLQCGVVGCGPWGLREPDNFMTVTSI